MPTLRLTQRHLDPGFIEAAFEEDGTPPLVATTTFAFQVSPQDQEDLRWYLEDSLHHAHDPASTIARRVEERMGTVGAELFRAVFEANDETREVWRAAQPRLGETRVEVVTSVREAVAIPWELLRDPERDAALVLQARAFVRAEATRGRQAREPQAQQEEGPVPILVAICRPRGGEDVPFRSVALRLLQGLREQGEQEYRLEVLRPPTFEALASKLRRAAAEGRPYHLVHFDGHGCEPWC